MEGQFIMAQGKRSDTLGNDIGKNGGLKAQLK